MAETNAGGDTNGVVWWWTDSEKLLDLWWKSLPSDTRHWLMTNTKTQHDEVVAKVIRGTRPNTAVETTVVGPESAALIPATTFAYVRARAYEAWRHDARFAFWT